jgi:hypothetical protein
VSGTIPTLIARRLASWEARKPEAMTVLSLQASKLSSLPAILLTLRYPLHNIHSANFRQIGRKQNEKSDFFKKG